MKSSLKPYTTINTVNLYHDRQYFLIIHTSGSQTNDVTFISNFIKTER